MAKSTAGPTAAQRQYAALVATTVSVHDVAAIDYINLKNEVTQMREYDAAQVICDTLDLREVFEAYGYTIKRGMCCCPFHGERTASCSVNNKFYHCFACGASGNVISFVKRLFDTDFKHAVQKLDNDFNLKLLQSSSVTRLHKRRPTLTPEQQQKQRLEALRKEYDNAWRYVIIYEPQSPLAEINKLYIQGVNTVNRLDEFMRLYDWHLTYDDAKQLFTKKGG